MFPMFPVSWELTAHATLFMSRLMILTYKKGIYRFNMFNIAVTFIVFMNLMTYILEYYLPLQR